MVDSKTEPASYALSVVPIHHSPCLKGVPVGKGEVNVENAETDGNLVKSSPVHRKEGWNVGKGALLRIFMLGATGN